MNLQRSVLMNSKKFVYANIISFLSTPFKSIYLLFVFKNISFRHIKDYAFLLQDKKYLKKIATKYMGSVIKNRGKNILSNNLLLKFFHQN